MTNGRAPAHAAGPWTTGQPLTSAAPACAAHGPRVNAFMVSRDAGAELTEHVLRPGITAEALSIVAAGAADYADAAQEMVHREYRPALACREGCSYCCRKPGVLVTMADVVRILVHVTAHLDAGEMEALRGRAAGYARQMQGRHFNTPVAESVSCPLLVEGRCSVYESRPLACRGFNSINADACREAHGRPEALIPVFALLRDVTDGTAAGVAQQLQRAGLQESMVDLGGALHIALERGEGTTDALADGERVLAPVDASSWVEELWQQVCCGGRLQPADD